MSKAEGDDIDRAKLEDLLKQRFFYDMSFSIYGGEQQIELWTVSLNRYDVSQLIWSDMRYG